MSTLRQTALVTVLGTALMLAPRSAQAHWRPFFPPGPRVFFPHPHFYGPGAVIGLGIAGAVLGTAAIVDSLIPHPVYVAPPPPPPYNPYEDAYRRGYYEGRRDSYDDRRYRRDDY